MHVLSSGIAIYTMYFQLTTILPGLYILLFVCIGKQITFQGGKAYKLLYTERFHILT